jgi:proline iminopeptidase
VLFDQRGCGRSNPFGEVKQNTTQDLIADMERIRAILGIEKWLLFGGSWGGALALLYAQQYPEAVLALIIRGVFLARQEDMAWFAGCGVNRIYPEQWQYLLKAAPENTKNKLIPGLWQAINGEDVTAQLSVARAWQSWNGQVALGKAFQAQENDPANPEVDIKQVRMELHFAINNYFIAENQILENCHVISSIPTVVIHGRYDLVCPLEAGLSLHKALPNSDFVVLPNAGHIAQHEEMIDALVSATDRFAQSL